MKNILKRRFFAALLAVLMVFTGILFSACNREPTAKELLTKAELNTAALDSYAAVMKMDMSMSMMGMTIDVPMTVDMKIKNTLPSPVLSAHYDMSMIGQQIKMDLYSDGEWMYFSIPATEFTEALQYKTKMSAADEYNFNEDVADLLKELPEDLLKDVKPIKNEDGSYTISATLPTESFNEIYNDLLDSLSADYAATDVEIGNTKVEITVTADGYYKEYIVDFTMKMNIEDVEADATAKLSVVFENPGEPVEIVPIEGCENFPEIEM